MCIEQGVLVGFASQAKPNLEGSLPPMAKMIPIKVIRAVRAFRERTERQGWSDLYGSARLGWHK
jgi:hypothetical protein